MAVHFVIVLAFCLTTQVLQACSTQLHLPLIRMKKTQTESPTNPPSTEKTLTLRLDTNTSAILVQGLKMFMGFWLMTYPKLNDMKIFQCCFSQLQDPFLYLLSFSWYLTFFVLLEQLHPHPLFVGLCHCLPHPTWYKPGVDTSTKTSIN